MDKKNSSLLIFASSVLVGVISAGVAYGVSEGIWVIQKHFRTKKSKEQSAEDLWYNKYTPELRNILRMPWIDNGRNMDQLVEHFTLVPDPEKTDRKHKSSVLREYFTIFKKKGYLDSDCEEVEKVEVCK